MRSCLCRWTSQLLQSLELPRCYTLRTVCRKRLAGVSRGGPGCSSQLPEAGRLGLPGTIPSHHCLGAHRQIHPLFSRNPSSSLLPRFQTLQFSWAVTWLFDHRENTFIIDSRPGSSRCQKCHTKPKNNPVPIPSSRIKFPSLSPPLPLL